MQTEITLWHKRLRVCFLSPLGCLFYLRALSLELSLSPWWHVSMLTLGHPVWGTMRGSQSGEGGFNLCLDFYLQATREPWYYYKGMQVIMSKLNTLNSQYN